MARGPAPVLATGEKKEDTTVGLSTNEARNNFSETLNRVRFRKERFALTRRGKVLAIMVPADKHTLPLVTVNITSVNARDSLSEIVNRVHYSRETIGIGRHGATTAVVMSPEDYHEVRSTQLSQEEGVEWSTFKEEHANRPTSRRKAELRKPPKPS
jgi:PHD/YefM family antitoxin component YafN of YafNO toxin-antitoxin module